MKAVILAAGKGERLKPLTDTKPKHILPVGGAPLLEWPLRGLAEMGISEALIATALGLAAAIPAVIAYNAFQNGIKTVSDEIENFSADFLNLVGRHFMRL